MKKVDCSLFRCFISLINTSIILLFGITFRHFLKEKIKLILAMTRDYETKTYLRWHIGVLIISHLKNITVPTSAYVLDDFVSTVEQSSCCGGHSHTKI
jgi:hypothetical protein